MRTYASWPSALRGVLLYRGRRWRTELAAVEHGIIALLALLEAYRGREHVGSALGLLDLVHPPIRDLTGIPGISRAGSTGSDASRRHAALYRRRRRPHPQRRIRLSCGGKNGRQLELGYDAST